MQYAWLKNDLENNFDRQRTPWLIASAAFLLLLLTESPPVSYKTKTTLFSHHTVFSSGKPYVMCCSMCASSIAVCVSADVIGAPAFLSLSRTDVQHLPESLQGAVLLCLVGDQDHQMCVSLSGFAHRPDGRACYLLAAGICISQAAFCWLPAGERVLPSDNGAAVLRVRHGPVLQWPCAWCVKPLFRPRPKPQAAFPNLTGG